MPANLSPRYSFSLSLSRVHNVRCSLLCKQSRKPIKSELNRVVAIIQQCVERIPTLLTSSSAIKAVWNGVFSSVEPDTLPVALLFLCRESLHVVCTQCSSASWSHLLPFIFLFPLTGNVAQDTDADHSTSTARADVTPGERVALLWLESDSQTLPGSWYADVDLIRVGSALFRDARLYEYATVSEAAIPFIVDTIAALEPSLYERLPETQVLRKLLLPRVTYDLLRTIRLVSALLKVLHSFPGEFISRASVASITECLLRVLQAVRASSRKRLADNTLLVVAIYRVLSAIGQCHPASLSNAISWSVLSDAVYTTTSTLGAQWLAQQPEADESSSSNDAAAVLWIEFRTLMRAYFDRSQACATPKLFQRTAKLLCKVPAGAHDTAAYVLAITAYLEALLSGLDVTRDSMIVPDLARSKSRLRAGAERLVPYLLQWHSSSATNELPSAAWVFDCSSKLLGLLGVLISELHHKAAVPEAAELQEDAMEQEQPADAKKKQQQKQKGNSKSDNEAMAVSDAGESELQQWRSDLGRATWLSLGSALVERHNAVHPKHTIHVSMFKHSSTKSAVPKSLAQPGEHLALLTSLRLLFRSTKHSSFLSAKEYVHFIVQFFRQKIRSGVLESLRTKRRSNDTVAVFERLTAEVACTTEVLGEIFARSTPEEFALLLSRKAKYVEWE